jgi:hypothetical protein
MKIIDRIQEQNGQPFFSFEYFPPKTAPGLFLFLKMAGQKNVTLMRST